MNTRNPSQEWTRREFLRGAARYGLLAATAAVAVAITGRRRAPGSCVNQGLCSGCPVLAECGLPQALSARRASQGGLP